MRWQWHVGLGRELGNAFWALVFFEAVFGAYTSIWPLWIERQGAPISVVGLVLGFSGLVRPFVLGPSSLLFDRFDTRNVLLAARALSVVGLIVAVVAGSWQLLLLTVATNAIGELVFPAIQTFVADHAGDDPVHSFNMVVTMGPSAALIVTPLLSGVVIAVAGIRGALILAALFTMVGMYFVSRMRFSQHHQADAEEERATYRATLRHPLLRRIVIMHGLTIGALAIGASLISNFLEIERGMRASLIATLSSGAAIGTVVYGLTSSRIRVLRQSPILGAAIATALVATGYLILASQSAISLITLAYVLRGGIFSAWALFLAQMGKDAPPRLRSRAFATLEILGGSAMSFGPIIAAQLWNIDPLMPFLVSAALSLTMSAVLFGVARGMTARSAEGTTFPSA